MHRLTANAYNVHVCSCLSTSKKLCTTVYTLVLVWYKNYLFTLRMSCTCVYCMMGLCDIVVITELPTFCLISKSFGWEWGLGFTILSQNFLPRLSLNPSSGLYTTVHSQWYMYMYTDSLTKPAPFVSLPQLAEGNDSRPNFSHEIDLPEDEPPPYVPPYRGDDLESEMSIPMGESCSQPPHSPQLCFDQRNNSRNRTNHDRSGGKLQPGHDHNVPTPTTCSFNIFSSDNEEEDTEFIDNEAYQKVGESQFAIAGLPHVESGGFGSQNTMISSNSHCSPIAMIEGRGCGSCQRLIEDNDSSKPRFKIGKGGRRGDVFEKVELHHWLHQHNKYLFHTI